MFSGCMLALIALASCNNDGYENVTRQIYAPAISIITDLDDQSVNVKEGNYFFNLEISTTTGQTGTVTSPELIANNNSLGFTTELQDYKTTNYDVYFSNAQATVSSNSSLKINNATFEAIYPFEATMNPYNGYYYNLEDVGNLTYAINYQQPWITIAKFNIGDEYRVNTFPKDSFFKGTTNTTYPFQGIAQNYNTEDITYRFILQKEENSAVYKAILIMYNAKFSAVPQEPTKTVVVRGLDVDFSATGVRISGENIIPQMYSQGEGFVDAENFKVNNLEFNTTDPYYINGNLTYTVAGIYEGNFNGSYIKDYYLYK